MERVQLVRRKIFSNTAGVLNWPSFSISIDFPTVYIDFLNILSKVGTCNPKRKGLLVRFSDAIYFIDPCYQEHRHRQTFSSCNIRAVLSVIRLFVGFYTEKCLDLEILSLNHFDQLGSPTFLFTKNNNSSAAFCSDLELLKLRHSR